MMPFLRYWLPLLLWLCVIFSASADTRSTERTSRFLEPFLRWIKPDISAEAIGVVRLIARKTAHVVEYAILAWLTWRAFRRPIRGDRRPWSWRLATGVLLCVILYAASDEWHQAFVPNRTGAFTDVCIDVAGGIIGIALVWLFYGRNRD
jgi:VanZ family protein